MADGPVDTSRMAPAEKRELLARLLARQAQAAAEAHPLSHGQRSLWFLSKLAPESAAYTIMYAGRFRSEVDVARLERAVRSLVARHPMLRTTYTTRDGEPVQLTHPRMPARLAVVDGAGWDDERVDQWLDAETNRRFDLETGPVLRASLLELGYGEHLLLLTVPHIAADFWSLDIIVDELCRCYRADAGAPPPGTRYLDHVRWQSELLAGPAGEENWRYWQRQLGGELPALHLPTDHPRPATQTYRGAVHSFTVAPALDAALRQLSRAEGVTLYVVLLAGFVALLHRYSGQQDILVGSPMAGRDRAGLEDVVGYFANPVVLRPDLTGDPTFRSFLDRVRGTVLAAVAHQDYPFGLLVERLRPVRDLSYSPLFQVSVSWEKPRLVRTGPDEPWLEALTVRQGGAPIDLMLLLADRGESLSAALQYNTDLFHPETIARLAGHLTTLLAGAAAEPGRRLRELPLLTGAERRQRTEWNATAVDHQAGACLHQLVEAQVDRNPDAVAVVFRDHQLTYRELEVRANQLAHRLRALGVRPGAVVGVCLERSVELVVGLLAVLKAGGAFLPVDPDQPRDRSTRIVADAGVAVLVTEHRLRDRRPDAPGPVVCLDTDAEAIGGERADRPACLTGGTDVAYVIYTSGSTGVPKGALNTHRGICNRLLWMQAAYRLAAGDRVLHKTPVSFDVSIWELCWPLLAGAGLVIAEPGGHRDGHYLVRTIVAKGVTVVHFVPSMLRAFLAAPGVDRCHHLRHVVCSGEPLPAALRDACLDLLPAALHNLYGPTEAAIDVTYFDCPRGSRDPVVPIGQPIANVQVHLLDARLRPVPVGVTGELYLAGAGVARGYLGQPGLTAASFHPDPFAAEPGARMYRSGDLGRYLPDGNIELLGRVDRQVKIRGVRVELDEVEAALARHPDVYAGAVVDRADGQGDRKLVAYLVPRGSPAPSTTELRRFLLGTLPDAMVPAVFVALAALPLTPSGKVDRRALPEPGTARPDLEVSYVAPRNPTERALAEIWREVLAVDRVGIHDDFFALGGASTQSLQVVARGEATGLTLTPELVFRHPTIAELAAACEPGSGEGSAPAALPPAPARGAGTAAAPAAGQQRAQRTVIESLGVYLPARVVSTAEILRGCRQPVELPLEKLTGIRTRRVAGEHESSADLAARAIEECLARSRRTAADIELLICCSISRCDGPGNQFTLEPSTSVRLRHQLGFRNAVTFDVTNACAGMFTGILIADAFLRTGRVSHAMVVSGERVSNLIGTAQQEISGFLDQRLACLTVGDAGAALILERGTDPDAGFHEIDMCTLSRYSSLCLAKATDQPHGGPIMLTDSVNQTAIAVTRAVPYAAALLHKQGWLPVDLDHLVMHQTSESSLNDAVTAIDQLFPQEVTTRERAIYNLAERGNTASTSHFVAVDDHIRSQRIRTGDKVLFSITGSGQTIGAALYTFDDLPDRIRANGAPRRHSRPSATGPPPRPAGPRVRIDNIATVAHDEVAGGGGSLDLAVRAAAACLDGSALPRRALDLLIHTGVYREDFLSEPAVATLVAGALGINDDVTSPDDDTTLAFDVLNGGLGFLTACHLAMAMIEGARAENVMVVASEVENNGDRRPDLLRGIRPAGSAVTLRRADGGTAGFGQILFTHHTGHLAALRCYTRHASGTTYLQTDRDPSLEDCYLRHIPAAVTRLLRLEGLDLSMIKAVFPPQISTSFLAGLGDRLGASPGQLVEVAADGRDWFTSSAPLGLRRALDERLVGPGDIGLVIEVGAGVQVACATYRF